ncbi:MAG: NAD(P)H-dependent glycerol-3-phosphate dehydrogenase [Pseudomonadota bacterium]
MPERIAVIGAGSWGTALAKILAEKGDDVLMWAYEAEVAAGINSDHRNPLYLSQTNLPDSIRATADIREALEGRDVAVSVVPSRTARAVWKGAASHLEKNAVLVSCTKGIETESLKLMSQVLSECLPAHPASHRTVLSGPSFAQEVAKGLLTSVVIAGGDPVVRRNVQDLFRSNTFLTFTSEDVTGVEVGGAVKNVIAITAGISDGLDMGHNSRAAIITRGLYEMIKIGKALGANPLTFAGLSGIGDLILTCTADLSRNHAVGRALGNGKSIAEILAEMKMVAEGVPTAKAIHALAGAHHINAPICEATYRILFEGLGPKQAVLDLCAMPLKEELGAILK